MFKSVVSELVPIVLKAHSSLQKPTSILTHASIRSLSSSFNRISFINSPNALLKPKNSTIIGQIGQISTTPLKCELMEFFDDKKNWGEKTVKHGREWYLPELRLKSNVDLHKLWFVLSKERNMLLTMQEAYIKNYEALPSPERLAKIDESMSNILKVVQERDEALSLLETGKSNQRLAYKRYNSFGYPQDYKPTEHLIPWFLNSTWKLKYHSKNLQPWTKFYRTKLRLIESNKREKKLKRAKALKNMFLKKYPDLYTDKDKEFLDEYVTKKYKIEPEKTIAEVMRRPGPDGLFKDQS